MFELVAAKGVRFGADTWKASFASRFWSNRLAALYHPAILPSSGLSVPDSAILSWVVVLSPRRNFRMIVMGSVYPDWSMRSRNSSM